MSFVPTLPIISAPSPPRLTPREWEVLRLIAQGLSNPQIAQQLVLSVLTVKEYAHNIYVKTGTHNRVEATLWLARQNDSTVFVSSNSQVSIQ